MVRKLKLAVLDPGGFSKNYDWASTILARQVRDGTVAKKNGGRYTPKTVYRIVRVIRRYLVEKNRPDSDDKWYAVSYPA